LATAYTLTAAIKKLGRFNLIICGGETVNEDKDRLSQRLWFKSRPLSMLLKNELNKHAINSLRRLASEASS